MYHRADTEVTDDLDRQAQKSYVNSALTKRGYPRWALEKAVQPKNKKPTSTESKPASKGSVAIPYVKGFSEALKRTYNTYSVNAYSRPTRTLRQILVSPKDKTEKKDITGPIYGVFCQGQTTRGKCEEFYIGETERSLKNCFLEHNRPSSTSSEVLNHIHIESPGHHIDLDEVKILDREPHWFERGVKEAIFIKVNKLTLNKDGGCYKLPGVYESILRSSVPKVTTWDSLTLVDERQRIVWKFRGMEIFLS